jgi:hypothetical protein
MQEAPFWQPCLWKKAHGLHLPAWCAELPAEKKLAFVTPLLAKEFLKSDVIELANRSIP